ncbi:hypothetical protein HK097_009407 [Rhizophlyctis rosea]|uniref:CBF1-interacting co-repressor CIR N-terminal domain-containing protein n=1 Tax=Rhizophlyctis rosea TaxID=64517 RepID=A0AAD5SHU3_9FUNG|nr:hypothetical protein HK097_009407 [Rhizophlyctis rosea]
MGKLNILQHKSWHVYSEKNREKVRRDEEKARVEEAKKAERALQADREARLNTLRANSKARNLDPGDTYEQLHNAPNEPPQHINFFPELETGRSASRGNAELEAERKAEKAKEEQKHTWYFGETRDGKKEVPWYATKDMKAPTRTDASGRPLKAVDDKKKKDKDDRRKSLDDPLALMEKYAKRLKKSDKEKNPKGASSSTSSTSSIESLRAERLKRETAERQRTELLLNPHLAKTPTQHERETTFYNSQFNPDFVRRPKDLDETKERRPWERREEGRYGQRSVAGRGHHELYAKIRHLAYSLNREQLKPNSNCDGDHNCTCTRFDIPEHVFEIGKDEDGRAARADKLFCGEAFDSKCVQACRRTSVLKGPWATGTVLTRGLGGVTLREGAIALANFVLPDPNSEVPLDEEEARQWWIKALVGDSDDDLSDLTDEEPESSDDNSEDDNDGDEHNEDYVRITMIRTKYYVEEDGKRKQKDAKTATAPKKKKTVATKADGGKAKSSSGDDGRAEEMTPADLSAAHETASGGHGGGG